MRSGQRRDFQTRQIFRFPDCTEICWGDQPRHPEPESDAFGPGAKVRFLFLETFRPGGPAAPLGARAWHVFWVLISPKHAGFAS